MKKKIFQWKISICMPELMTCAEIRDHKLLYFGISDEIWASRRKTWLLLLYFCLFVSSFQTGSLRPQAETFVIHCCKAPKRDRLSRVFIELCRLQNRKDATLGLHLRRGRMTVFFLAGSYYSAVFDC